MRGRSASAPDEESKPLFVEDQPAVARPDGGEAPGLMRGLVSKARAVAAWSMRACMMTPIVLVTGLVVMEWYTFIMVFQVRRFEQEPLIAILYVVVFTSVAILCEVSYLRCVFTLNSVQANPPPPRFDVHECRRCLRCTSLKPERTHHCSMCRQCTLRMDHHCPWVANCVGHYNYKYFMLFLFWTTTGCFLYLLGGWSVLLQLLVNHGINPNLDLLTFFGALLSFSFGICLSGFTGYHLFLTLNNMTSLEHAFSDGVNPYDLGKRRNFEMVFGPRKRFWLLPVPSVTLTGWDFHRAMSIDALGSEFDNDAFDEEL